MCIFPRHPTCDPRPPSQPEHPLQSCTAARLVGGESSGGGLMVEGLDLGLRCWGLEWGFRREGDEAESGLWGGGRDHQGLELEICC